MTLSENYIIVRKKVKNTHIRVSHDKTVRVIVPLYYTKAQCQSLVRSKQDWIEKQFRYFDTKIKKIDLAPDQILLFGQPYTFYLDSTCKRKVIVDHDHESIQSGRDLLNSDELLKWYKSQAKAYILPRIEQLSSMHGFEYSRVFMRGQKTKWGNCTSNGNLSMNWKLIKAPVFVIDYVILHELVHTKIMNHSKKFWSKLEAILPSYKDAADWLKMFGTNL